MELKWLEDFVSLSRTRSFSRSAEERNVTQSAFSRRVQALEAWLGVSLIDRSTYPTALTPEGRQFLDTAVEAVRMLYAGRLDAQKSARPGQHTISIAALHTLSLRFFPRWLREVEAAMGSLNSRLLPDDFHRCLQALVEGSYDFLLTFHHDSAPVPLDPNLYPSIVVGVDSLIAVARPEVVHSARDEQVRLPLLGYARDSYLGRVAAFAQGQEGAPRAQVTHTNENAMADALKFMALEGHGLAWLPRSLVVDELFTGSLVTLGPETSMEIRLYRESRRSRPVIDTVWSSVRSMVRNQGTDSTTRPPEAGRADQDSRAGHPSLTRP